MIPVIITAVFSYPCPDFPPFRLNTFYADWKTFYAVYGTSVNWYNCVYYEYLNHQLRNIITGQLQVIKNKNLHKIFSKGSS